MNHDGEVVYDVYVKSDKPITDYRAQWSGIRPKHMKNAITFRSARKKVKRLIKKRSGEKDIKGKGGQSSYHCYIFTTLFKEILSDSDHRLRALLPPSHQVCKYSLRRTRKFDIPKENKKSARNSFIIKSSFNINTV